MYEIYCEVRDRRGYSDADVSRLTGIGSSTFSDWKSGRSKPKAAKLEKIAKALAVSVDYLMTGKEYYTNLGTADAAQELYDSELQGLMDAARDCPPEVIRSLKDLALQFKETNRDG